MVIKCYKDSGRGEMSYFERKAEESPLGGQVLMGRGRQRREEEGV